MGAKFRPKNKIYGVLVYYKKDEKSGKTICHFKDPYYDFGSCIYHALIKAKCPLFGQYEDYQKTNLYESIVSKVLDHYPKRYGVSSCNMEVDTFSEKIGCDLAWENLKDRVDKARIFALKILKKKAYQEFLDFSMRIVAMRIDKSSKRK